MSFVVALDFLGTAAIVIDRDEENRSEVSEGDPNFLRTSPHDQTGSQYPL